MRRYTIIRPRHKLMRRIIIPRTCKLTHSFRDAACLLAMSSEHFAHHEEIERVEAERERKFQGLAADGKHKAEGGGISCRAVLYLVLMSYLCSGA